MNLLVGTRYVGFVCSAGARVGMEGSGGIGIGREEPFVAHREASASRSGGKRSLSVFSL